MNAALAAVDTIRLRQLRLKPGMFMQVHSMLDRQVQSETKFCAAIEGKGLMVVPLQDGPHTPDWREGSALTVRGFTGQYDFSFPTRVLGNFTVPFAYVLLSYPDEISARQVRAALRIRTSLPAMAWGRDERATVPARVVDLSVAGALIELGSPLGGSGDKIGVAVSLPIEQGEQAIQLRGSIAHVAEGAAGAGTRVGVSFNDLARHDRLALQAFTLSANQSQGVIE